jgi:hypothetical protein
VQLEIDTVKADRHSRHLVRRDEGLMFRTRLEVEEGTSRLLTAIVKISERRVPRFWKVGCGDRRWWWWCQ